MIKLERCSVMNLENAMRGARNPMNSWARSDSAYDDAGNYVLGANDLDLAGRLGKSGERSPEIHPADFRVGGHHRAPVLVEGIRHLQGRHGRKLDLDHAQNPRQGI